MTAAAADFAALIEPVATRLLGEPNRKLSSKTELRFGGRGSLSVDLGTGVFFDHESGEGGGTLDLIAREKGLDKAGCVQWLVEERLLSNGEDRAHKPRIVATYRYEGEGGELLFEVVRFEPKDLRSAAPGSGQAGRVAMVDARRAPGSLPPARAYRGPEPRPPGRRRGRKGRRSAARDRRAGDP